MQCMHACRARPALSQPGLSTQVFKGLGKEGVIGVIPEALMPKEVRDHALQQTISGSLPSPLSVSPVCTSPAMRHLPLATRSSQAR
jgi:hypothetical protein